MKPRIKSILAAASLATFALAGCGSNSLSGEAAPWRRGTVGQNAGLADKVPAKIKSAGVMNAVENVMEGPRQVKLIGKDTAHRPAQPQGGADQDFLAAGAGRSRGRGAARSRVGQHPAAPRSLI